MPVRVGGWRRGAWGDVDRRRRQGRMGMADQGEAGMECLGVMLMEVGEGEVPGLWVETLGLVDCHLGSGGGGRDYRIVDMDGVMGVEGEAGGEVAIEMHSSMLPSARKFVYTQLLHSSWKGFFDTHFACVLTRRKPLHSHNRNLS